jgi:hypothetical protein
MDGPGKPTPAVVETQATGTGESSTTQWIDSLRSKQIAAGSTGDPPVDAAGSVGPPKVRPGVPVPGVPTVHDLAEQDARDLAYNTNHRMEDAAKVLPLAAMGGVSFLSGRNFLSPPVKKFFDSKATPGNRFGSLLTGEGTSMVLDHLTDDNLNHRFTNLNDLVVDPLIATRMRGNFAVKAGVMVGTHILGRVIDYFVHEDPAGALAEHKPDLTPPAVMQLLSGKSAPLLPVEAPTAPTPPHKIEFNPLAGATVTDADRHNQELNRARQLGVTPQDLPYTNGGPTESYRPTPVKPALGDPNVAPPGQKPATIPPSGNLFY